MLYIKGYNFFKEKIKELRKIKIKSEKRTKFLENELNKIDNNIKHFEGLDHGGAMNNAIKKWHEDRQLLSDEFIKLSIDNLKNDLELEVYISAQRQLKWGGMKVSYPEYPG